MAVFPTTQWTRILEAQATPARAAVAWQELLLRYWQPLYAFFRAKGLSPSDAQDAVQGFSLELMEHETLFEMTPERGRLRGFLKVAAENFLLHQYEKSQAAKRGGGLRPIPIDEANAERWASSDAPPDAAFERAWALSDFQRALSEPVVVVWHLPSMPVAAQ